MADIMFTCAPQVAAATSWIDTFPALKTLTPPIITGGVTAFMASLAYFVSKSQREIAANKYILDLFEKRYPEYEKFLNLFRRARENDDLDFNTRADVSKNKTLIKKCSRMFSGISVYCESLINSSDDLERTENELISCNEPEFEEFLGGDVEDGKYKLDEAIKSTLNHIARSTRDKDTGSENYYREHLNELLDLQLNFHEKKKIRDKNVKEINEIKYDICELKNRIKTSLITILDSMEAQLTLSHDPYKR